MYSKSTTQTKLALIPYLNCEPFYVGIDELDLEIVYEPPRALGEIARHEGCTCGPMAVADLFTLREHYEPLDDFGITCEGRAHSVLLFAKRPIEQLQGARIGLTTESSTSVQLLRVLLTRKFELECLTFERGTTPEDSARLLIGDQALSAAAEGLDDFPFVYDLGEEWHGWQSLPFVFARWVVAKAVPTEERARIVESLSNSLANWREHLPAITARRGPDFGFSQEDIHEYLSTFAYRIGSFEELGERTFEGLLKEIN